MNSLKPSLEIDVKAAAGAAAQKSRAGNLGRHHGKMPDLFPDVLADVALSKNVGLEVASALVPSKKSTIRDDKADTGDRKEDLPPEEKTLQPAMPVEMKEYLQVVAAVAQTQTGGGEPAPPPVIAAALVSTVVPRRETQGANPKQTEDEFSEAPRDVVDLDAVEFPELKATDPRKPVDHSDKGFPIQSIGPRRVENLPEPKEIFQPKAAKEVSLPKAPEEVLQPKAVDVDLRVIKVETSFSPAASAPFVVQVAKIIVEGLGGQVHGSVPVIGNTVADPRPDVVKSIQIQLHPDDLGKIKVAMHLRGDELRLQIEVTSKAAETLLRTDHQALKDLIGQAGYDIKDASISITLSPADQNPPQRSVAAGNPSQESWVGQGGRQHPGTHEENQNPFHKARGHHGSASDFENGQEARVLAPGSRRGNGVFV